jgi:hypothetical protein
MGCDIHVVVERRKKSKDRWVGIYCTDFLSRSDVPIASRDYAFFGEIASVRCASTRNNYPRNLPEDISELAWQQYMECPTDHHSASHMSLQDMADRWFTVNESGKAFEIRREWAVMDLFGYIDNEDYEYRAVFWFDN